MRYIVEVIIDAETQEDAETFLDHALLGPQVMRMARSRDIVVSVETELRQAPQ